MFERGNEVLDGLFSLAQRIFLQKPEMCAMQTEQVLSALIAEHEFIFLLE